jgi:hypothetical protein
MLNHSTSASVKTAPSDANAENVVSTHYTVSIEYVTLTEGLPMRQSNLGWARSAY